MNPSAPGGSYNDLIRMSTRSQDHHKDTTAGTYTWIAYQLPCTTSLYILTVLINTTNTALDDRFEKIPEFHEKGPVGVNRLCAFISFVSSIIFS